MTFTRRSVFKAGAALAAAAVSGAGPARADESNTIKLGVLTDTAGPYSDLAGPSSIASVRQAAKEFADQGFRVEVVSADHQNKADIAANITRQWIDRERVDVIVDVPGSSAALAVAGVAREKNKVFLASGPAAAELTGPQCSPNTVHWTYDIYMLANSTGAAMVRAGGDTWFFITADYVFGQSMEADASRFVQAAGGKVLGSVRFPFPGTTDFSSFLVRAQASQAKVFGLAAGGSDLINAIKQAAEFGLTQRGAKLAALVMFITDVHSLGLEAAQGLVLSETFYWDLNDRTRAFTNRLKGGFGVQAPTMVHAGCYASALHYLKAVKDMGVAAAKASGADAVNRMKAMPTDDDAFGAGTIRSDGRTLHPAYLFEVKAPRESRAPWDYYKLLQTTPGEQAFRPLAEGGCPLSRT
ncbi:MAG: ABC transporter substrate-binding protein [Rhodopila sp.]|nr:ABC transporter substrate-binding protein [Rhodopila sp.]